MRKLIFLVAFVFLFGTGAVSAQHRNRDHNQGRDHNQHRERTYPTRPQPRFDTNQNRDRHRTHGPRIVIIPRITLGFPQYHRGVYVRSIFEVGYQDGFQYGKSDYTQGYPCDVNFAFNSNSRNYAVAYEKGFRFGYFAGCK